LLELFESILQRSPPHCGREHRSPILAPRHVSFVVSQQLALANHAADCRDYANRTHH
jgi:hypothetical protein